MDAFGDDPAADFLAREQEELGELGDELGLSTAEVVAETDNTANLDIPESREQSTPSPQFFISHPKPKEEPETIRVWKENYAKLLREKDEQEGLQMEELRDQAKKELADWYKHYEEQLVKTKASNRESEKEFVAEVNDILPGTEWERVTKLCDFNPKTSRHTKDMSRMKSILLHLKSNPVQKNAA